MKLIFIIFVISSSFQSLIAEWDQLVLLEDGGILVNDTTGFTTIDQYSKSVLCGTGKGQQGCTVNDRCCKCATGSCNTENITDDLAIVLKKISKSSALRLGHVATTLNDLIADIKSLVGRTDEILSRDELAKIIAKTFQSFELLLSIENNPIGDISYRIVEAFRLMITDLHKITEARTVEIKNSAANDLGFHIIVLIDITNEFSKIISDVCNLSVYLSEEIHSITLITTTIFFFVEQMLTTIAVQVNIVGLRDDTASNICLHVSLAVEQYVVIIQSISQCPDGESLKELIPTIESSLHEVRTKLSDGIGSAIGFKRPESPSLFGYLDGVLDCVRTSKQLKAAEATISDTIISLFDISKSILAARLSSSCINGYDGSVDDKIRKVLVYLHTTLFVIVNIEDDSFSCGTKLSMLLTTLNSIVVKIMRTIEDVMQSILILGDITHGSTSLIHLFEAVVSVAASVVQCVALIFTELINGSHAVNLPKAVPRIMLGVNSQIIEANQRLNQTSKAYRNDVHYNVDTFIEMSLTIQSLNEFKSNIPRVVTNLDCSKGDNTVDDAKSTKADVYVGQIKSSAERLSELSTDGFGKVIAEAVNEFFDKDYGTLIKISTVSLERGDVLKLVSLTISNYYFALVTLNSIFSCSHYGVSNSVF